MYFMVCVYNVLIIFIVKNYKDSGYVKLIDYF